MLKKSIVLLLLSTLLISTSTFATNSFQRKPITTVISNPTAYTLRGGEFRISTSPPLSISPLSLWYLILLTRFDYGVLNNLQLGTFAIANFLQFFNLMGKYHILHLSAPQIDIAFTGGFSSFLGTQTTLAGGSVASWRAMRNLGIHLGFNVGAFTIGGDSYTLSGVGTSGFLGIDFGILPNVKLLSELNLTQTGFGIMAGTLVRLWDFLGLKVAFNLPPSMVLGIISIRF